MPGRLRLEPAIVSIRPRGMRGAENGLYACVVGVDSRIAPVARERRGREGADRAEREGDSNRASEV